MKLKNSLDILQTIIVKLGHVSGSYANMILHDYSPETIREFCAESHMLRMLLVTAERRASDLLPPDDSTRGEK